MAGDRAGPRRPRRLLRRHGLARRPDHPAGGTSYRAGGFGSPRPGSGTVSQTALRWHLDRYLEEEPFDRGRRRLRADLADDTPGDPPSAADRVRRGTALAELGRWEETRREFAAYVEALPKPGAETPFASRPVAVVSSGAARALVELQLDNRAEFERIMREVEEGLPDMMRGSGPKGSRTLPRTIARYAWPSVLVDAPPPKDLIASIAPPPTGSTNRLPEFRGGTVIDFPVEAGVAYRQGDAAKVLRLLESRFTLGPGCTAPECFFLAMAAKKYGHADLAERALARGLALMAGTVKEPPSANDAVAFGGGPTLNTLPAWQTRVANETLRREAERVVRGKSP